MTTPYYDEDGIAIYQGEALTVLASLPSRSVAAVVTDPPYSSGGMFRSDRIGDPSQKYRGWSQNADGRHVRGRPPRPARIPRMDGARTRWHLPPPRGNTGTSTTYSLVGLRDDL